MACEVQLEYEAWKFDLPRKNDDNQKDEHQLLHRDHEDPTKVTFNKILSHNIYHT